MTFLDDKPTRIRPAVWADYDRLCPLFAELDRHHREARPDLFHPIEGPARSPGLVRGLIEGADSAILVAERREGLMGLVLLIERRIPASLVRPGRRVVEVENLVVTETARGQGIGRALLATAEAWARDRRIQSLELGVHEFNEGAVGFYHRAGMQTALRRMQKAV